MKRAAKAIGTRWEFLAQHWSVAHADGQIVEIVSVEAKPYDYVVRYEVGEQVLTDDGLIPGKRVVMLTAVDRELKPAAGVKYASGNEQAGESSNA